MDNHDTQPRICSQFSLRHIANNTSAPAHCFDAMDQQAPRHHLSFETLVLHKRRGSTRAMETQKTKINKNAAPFEEKTTHQLEYQRSRSTKKHCAVDIFNNGGPHRATKEHGMVGQEPFLLFACSCGKHGQAHSDKRLKILRVSSNADLKCSSKRIQASITSRQKIRYGENTAPPVNLS